MYMNCLEYIYCMHICICDSTVFDEKGKSLMNELSKEDLADMESITGEEYFSKMRYEY